MPIGGRRPRGIGADKVAYQRFPGGNNFHAEGRSIFWKT